MKLLFYIFFISISFISQAQKTFISFGVPNKNFKQVGYCQDTSGRILYVFQSKTTLHATIVHPQGYPELRSTITLTDEDKKYSLEEVVLMDKKPVLLYRNNKSQFVIKKITNTNQATIVKSFNLPDSISFMYPLESSNSFKLLCHNEKKNSFYLYSIEGDKEVAIHKIDIRSIFIKRSIIEDKTPYSKLHPYNMVESRSDAWNRMFDFYSNEKIIARDSLITFIFDDFEQSFLYSYNLNDSTLKIDTINHTNKGGYFKKIVIGGNSFIDDTYLYRVNMEENKNLNIVIYDLDSLTPQKSFTLNNKNYKFILNGPVVERTTALDGQSNYEGYSFNQNIFNKVDRKRLSIVVNKSSNDRIFITAGSFSFLQSTYIRTPTPRAGAVGGTSFIIGGYYSQNNFFGQNSLYNNYSSTVTFKSVELNILLQDSTLNNVQNSLPNNVYDKILEYQKAKLKLSESQFSITYKYKNAIHYGYFSKRTGNYTVIAFNY